MSDLKLFSFPGDFRALKALVAAQYNAVSIETPDFKVGTDNTTPEFLAKSPAGKVPLLQTSKGAIFESNAIARYVARLRRDTDLCGVSFFETGQVDSWVDFCSHELELPATMWVYPIFGFLDFRPQIFKKAQEDLFRALDVLEAHLTSRTFLVGNKVTLADIVCVCALLYPMKMVLDEEIREKYTSVTRWFTHCVGQEQFAAVVGDVPLCRVALTPAAAKQEGGKQKGGKKAAAKQEGGKKGGKKAAAKKEDKPAAAPAPAPAPKKAGNPLDDLPKSTMVLDAWKKAYSNSRGDYYASMPTFWEMLDREGYSVWFCEYNYNSENKVDFQTSNLVSGFVQRSDPLRKYAFGAMQILGSTGPYRICGAWLLRGQEIAPMLEFNADAEYYTWTKMELDNEEQRKRLADMWCAEEKIDGTEIMDSKVFK